MSDKTDRIHFLSSIFVIVIFLGACTPKTVTQGTAIIQPELSLTAAMPATDQPDAPTTTPEAIQTLEATLSIEPTQITPQELGYTGSNVFSEIDGMEMIYVPAGVFIMGLESDEITAVCLQFMDQENCDMLNSPDEEPVHIVNLNAFWIDKTEVTNAMYQKCVTSGVCTAPFNHPASPPDEYSNNPKYANYPVKQVYWEQAQTYCQWVGRSLPSEAQWEKAARGVDARLYPWGNEPPTDKLANFDKLYNLENIAAVGSYPSGASPYGVLDMAGNVEEWVADWYEETYYAISPIENPTGPDSGNTHIIRGGSLNNIDILSATRFWVHKSAYPDRLDGFRCAIGTSDNIPTPPVLERTLSLTDPLMQGEDVKFIQQRLVELGYDEVGTPDGLFGKMTKQAVRNFQKTNNLVIDGIVGTKTWYFMISEQAIRADE